MRTRRRLTLAAPPPDPFGEHRRTTYQERIQLLGGQFEFETSSSRLWRIVKSAYARLPAHSFGKRSPRFKLSLVLTPGGHPGPRDQTEPRPLRTMAGGSILCGALDGAGFAALTPQQRSGLIVVAQELLGHPYHIRYELLEFAVYVLAARAQRLIPLHAGCIGQDGQGVLLLGASGCGKSTLVMHSLLAGLDLLAEDSVLVQPHSLLATGVANFVHLQADSMRFLAAAQQRSLRRSSTQIRRRSGVRKLEIDVRQGGHRLASAPLRIRALVFLSTRTVPGHRPLLKPLTRRVMLRRLASSQRYAAQQPGWSAFCARLADVPAYELCRGAHPLAGVATVQELLSAK
jgi:energy-coupling factor transporter ATP-binding protein EcfA2